MHGIDGRSPRNCVGSMVDLPCTLQQQQQENWCDYGRFAIATACKTSPLPIFPPLRHHPPIFLGGQVLLPGLTANLSFSWKHPNGPLAQVQLLPGTHSTYFVLRRLSFPSLLARSNCCEAVLYTVHSMDHEHVRPFPSCKPPAASQSSPSQPTPYKCRIAFKLRPTSSREHFDISRRSSGSSRYECPI
ncbi:hypothetical protein T440DRAFT_54429 [Plenodomus tracheiphilus IPT5]|uniref:Uncharacterized protein n=1 Tax=Plenodomus tracheiphilus IPT5 TaxID=1408161 RepID=A0A6A7BA57_9PLEO|nr:hypothetical protein T440DRAFT_54429 [Plenodomus tracheiphilus IPT5]